MGAGCALHPVRTPAVAPDDLGGPVHEVENVGGAPRAPPPCHLVSDDAPSAAEQLSTGRTPLRFKHVASTAGALARGRELTWRPERSIPTKTRLWHERAKMGTSGEPAIDDRTV